MSWNKIWYETIALFILGIIEIFFCILWNSYSYIQNWDSKIYITCEYVFWCFADRASQYNLSNWPTKCTNSCFILSLLYASTCFEHYVLIIRRLKLYYTASGIITPSKKVAFIQLLKLFGVHLLYINCRIYRKCNLAVVNPYRTNVENRVSS